MRRLPLVLGFALLIAACGGDDDDAASDPTTTEAPAGDESTTTTEAPVDDTTTTTATTAPPEPFTILLANDDGVAGPGIDALAQALSEDPTIELVVVAPAEEQSGSGDTTTEGYTGTETTLPSGFPAIAVNGEPADAVNYGLDVVFAGTLPDLVITGINSGQNLGPLTEVSGTVGAARTAARRGIPALAVSAGLACEGCQFDFPSAVEAALAWLDEHRDALAAGTVVAINVPSCDPGGEIRGTVEVPVAADDSSGSPFTVADCTSTLADPSDDVAAFNAGFITITDPGLGE
jgi:5'-nucleotidase